MYIACPSCSTLYRIHTEHLRLAEGHVCCNQCNAIFNASIWVADSAQAARSLVAKTSTKTSAQKPAIYVVAADADFYAHPSRNEFSSVARQTHPEMPASLLLEEERSGLSQTAWWSLVASLLLTVTLVAQYVWNERAMLVNIPEFRASMETLCQQFGCDLPLHSNPAVIEMVTRDIRKHPQVGGALMINATMMNHGRYAQVWPLFQVSFTDITGATIATRQFRPDEYLTTQVERSMGLQPRQKTRLTLEVLDPGAKATSFQFDFL